MTVVRFDVTRREPFAEGRSFAEVGAYEKIEGVLHFAVDPLHPTNLCISDLSLAARDHDGRVNFEAEAVLITPVDPARGNGALILDIPNRGRTVTNWLNGALDGGMSTAGTAVPFVPYDGHLYRRGFSTLTVGWQTDMVPMEFSLRLWPPTATDGDQRLTGTVWAEIRPTVASRSVELTQLRNRSYPPLDRDESTARLYECIHDLAPFRPIPRERWRFARVTERGEEPSDSFVTLDGGFEPGHPYWVAYTAVDPPVVGSGLLALRDAAAFVKHGAEGLLARPFNRALGFGVSQTAIVLRHMFTLGLNVDEEGRQVFEGALTVIGGMRGHSEANHRFALPSAASFRGFAGLAPFSDQSQYDPLTGETDGVMQRLDGLGAAPKVIHLNTAHEYWIGAALLHSDPASGNDVQLPSSVRAYMIPGAQHIPGALPQTTMMTTWGVPARYGTSIVAYAPLLRAALVNLDAWVARDIQPPPSRVPRLSDGTGVRRDQTVVDRYARLPAVEPLPEERMRVPRAIDLGPEADRGIGHYPPREGATYPCVVSAVDQDMNDIAGIRWPEIEVPVGTHVGWNVLDTGSGRSEALGYLWGFTRFFSRDEAERESIGDPRPSLAARYSSREDYRTRVMTATRKLVEEGFLLPEDTDLVVENCVLRYDEALRVGPMNPPS